MTLIQSIHIVSKEELQYRKCEKSSLNLLNGGRGKLKASGEQKVLQEVKKVLMQLMKICFVQ